MMCCFYIKTPEVYQRTTVFGYATGILDFLGQFFFHTCLPFMKRQTTECAPLGSWSRRELSKKS